MEKSNFALVIDNDNKGIVHVTSASTKIEAIQKFMQNPDIQQVLGKPEFTAQEMLNFIESEKMQAECALIKIP